MRALLDVNVPIALLDADHVHHARARAWLAGQARQGWSSCPITQNGCIRIMSQPAYPNPVPTAAVIQRLGEATRRPEHEFWPDDISLLDEQRVDPTRVHGPRQTNDLYLLALAVHRGVTLATLDGSVPLSAVHGARDRHLTIL